MLKGFACNACKKDLVESDLKTGKSPRVHVEVSVSKPFEFEGEEEWDEYEHSGHLCGDCTVRILSEFGLVVEPGGVRTTRTRRRFKRIR